MEQVDVVQAGLFAFLEQAVSPFHAVEAGVRLLARAGFSEWTDDVPRVRAGDRFFVRGFGSSLFAFVVGENPRTRLRVAAAHTDFPCLRVKPNPCLHEHGYGKLNVEVYGGMIRSTWTDRPLSLAGKVALRGGSPYEPTVRLFDAGRPLMIVPHLAIHMNPDTNKGVELNPQKDLLPLFTMADGEGGDDFLLDFLAEELQVEKEAVLSYELTAYPVESPCLVGRRKEFVSAPRLDNMTSVYACLAGLMAGADAPADGISCVALFDNEEVGSGTKQGAASMLLPNLLHRVYDGLGLSDTALYADMGRGFCFSVDVAHALHPNAPEKNDVTNFPVLNGGVALKIAASQSYAGDAEAVAIVKALCDEGNVPYQMYVNRSDMRGGSTLGSLLSCQMPMRTMDIGAPILAMHAARETMGAHDQAAMNQLMAIFLASVPSV